MGEQGGIAEKRGVLPTTEKRGVLPTTEKRGVLPTTEKRGVLPTTEKRGVLPTTEKRGVLPTTEKRGVLPTTEKRGVLPTTEKRGVLPTPEGASFLKLQGSFQWRIQGVGGLTPPPSEVVFVFACQYMKIPVDLDPKHPPRRIPAQNPPPPLEEFLDPPLPLRLWPALY